MSVEPTSESAGPARGVASGDWLATFLMGCVNNITPDKFPRQGSYLGRNVEVCFHYDTSATLRGKIIRDDAEEPGELIIHLENGWVVRASECQYSLLHG